MKSRLVLGNLLLIGALIPSAGVMADCDWDCITPYVGADLQWRHMAFKNNLGENETVHNYPQGNLYVGTRINDCFGIELGYESTTERKHSLTEQGGNIAFGVPLPPATPAFGVQTKTSIRGFHFDLVGFLPVSDEYNLELLGSIGIAPLRLKVVQDVTFGVPNPAAFHREFRKTKWVPRVNVGIQHLFCFCEELGVRATAGWEGTSVFKNIANTTAGSPQRASLNDSWILGLGLFYNFY